MYLNTLMYLLNFNKNYIYSKYDRHKRWTYYQPCVIDPIAIKSETVGELFGVQDLTNSLRHIESPYQVMVFKR